MSSLRGPNHPRRRTLSGILFIVGPAAFVVGTFVAIVSYGPPTFHFASNSISDLQAVHCGAFDGQRVCSPAHAAANAGVFLAGVCLALGTLLDWPTITKSEQHRKPAYFLTVAGMAAAANAFTPEDVTLIGDVITAFIVFLAADVGLILLGRLSSKASGLARFLTYPALLGEFGFLVLTLWSLGITGPLGAGIEWLVVAPILVWMLITGSLTMTGQKMIEPNSH